MFVTDREGIRRLPAGGPRAFDAALAATYLVLPPQPGARLRVGAAVPWSRGQRERRVLVRRPRVRSADGAAEVAVPAHDLFASTQLLGEMALPQMMAKLSTRCYRPGWSAMASSSSRSLVRAAR
jgi:hypothetical protein